MAAHSVGKCKKKLRVATDNAYYTHLYETTDIFFIMIQQTFHVALQTLSLAIRAIDVGGPRRSSRPGGRASVDQRLSHPDSRSSWLVLVDYQERLCQSKS